MDLLIEVAKYLIQFTVILWLLIALAAYFIPVLDIWMSMTPSTTIYPLGPSVLLAIVSILFAIFVWPAGKYQGTLVFSTLDCVLFGYLCVSTIICSCVTYYCGDLKHVTVLQYLGTVSFGLVILCCG